MDRVISDEERIRRAQEVSARRRNRIPVDNFNNISQDKHKLSRFEKFFLQTITSICLFGVIYFVNQNYSYAVEKIKPVMDEDTDFNQIYGYVNSVFYNIGDTNETNESNNSAKDSSGETEKNLIETKGNESKITEENNINNQEGSSDENNNKNANEIKTNNNDEGLDDISYIKKYANFIKPVNGIVTSWYGERQATDIVSAYHKGIDIGASTGTPIYSCIDGKVEKVLNYGDYGKHIKITNGEISVLYAHCSQIEANVGDEVKQGQKIAEVGTTGRSTGPHLHIEILRNERNVDPEKILQY